MECIWEPVITLVSDEKCSILLEPIGGSAPKFSFDTETVTGLSRKQSLSISLQCPAQGSPIPSFR